MNTVRLQVLDMVADEKITVDEAVRLLKAMGRTAGRRFHAAGTASLTGKSEPESYPEYVFPPIPDQVRFDNILLR